MFVFSENLACSVFMKHPFLDLPFCLITDNLSLINGSLTFVLLSVFYWLTLNCRRKTKLALGTVQTVFTQIFINSLPQFTQILAFGHSLVLAHFRFLQTQPVLSKKNEGRNI